MGSCPEMDNTVSPNITEKSALKATPAVRIAFDELVSEKRFLKSSETILKYFASLMSPGQEHEELCEDAKYVIKRVITSLASQRIIIRRGCYTIFQVMLQLYPQILTFSWSYIEIFYKDNMQKSLTNNIMGHALALGAIIRSGLAIEEELPLEDLIKKLLNMNDSKYVVGPVVGQFLVNLLSMYKDPNIPQTLWREGKQSLLADLETLSLPLLWLRVLIAREEYIKDLPDVPKSFQKNTYDESTYEYVLSVLKKLHSKGVNITPIVEDYFKSLILYQPSNSDEDNLSLFFSTAVTPALTSSDLKANVLLFNISQVALSHLTSKKSIEAVLSPELMEMLILSCRSDIEEVSASARGLFSAILQLLVKNKETDSKIQVAVMKRLVSTSSNFKLDAFTKTTILHQASDNLSAESVIGFVKFLVKNSRNFASDKSCKLKKFKEIVSTCHWINRLMGHSSLIGVSHHSWKAEQVSHLFRIAFLSGFNSKQQQQQILKDCFLKGLTQCSNNFEFQTSFIEEIVKNIRQLVANDQVKELNKDQIDLFISISDKLEKLPSEGNDTLSSDDVAVFKILYGYLSLGVFIDSKDSEGLVEEIKLCYKKAFKGKNKKGESLERLDEEGEEPEWREVVIDFLLSLISKEESFWKKVATVIFMNICHKIKPSVLSLLTDIINPEKDEPILEGKTDEEAMDHSSIIDGGEVDDLDTSMEVDTEEMSETEEDESDDDDDDDDIDEEKDADKLNLINLKKKMQEIVGLPMESVELDSVPQEELDNLDNQLGSLISEYVTLSNKRKKKKAKFTKDETALMHFRTRVCDLLETLIKEAPSLEHLLQVIKPILLGINKTLEDKLQSHLLAKLRSLIVDVSKVKKFGKPSSISAEKLATYLNDIFFMANNFSNLMSADVDQCYTFLVRSEQYLNTNIEKESNVVMKAYTDYLEKAFSGTSTDIYDGPIHLETVSLEMVLKVLSEVIFKKNTQPFKKKKGSEMLKLILSNEKALNKISSDNLNVVLQKIQREIINAFDYVKETKHIQSNYLVLLIEILKTLKKILNLNPVLEQFEWEKINQSITSFNERVSLTNFKVLKQAIQSLGNINNLELKSNNGKKNNSSEDRDTKQSRKERKLKKKRKLEEEEENKELEEKEKDEERTVGEEKKEENVSKRIKTESKGKNDLDETGEKKKKKKKKKHNQEERIKKNEKRLWLSDEIGDLRFASVNHFEADM